MRRLQGSAAILLGMLAFLLLLSLTGCGSSQGPASSAGGKQLTVRDSMDREVQVPFQPKRVVVFSASFLEPWHAVGGEVVGRPDSKTKLPEFAREAESVGAVYRIDMEKVLALQPDLVIVNDGMNEKLLKTLEMNHIPAIVVSMKSYAEVQQEVRLFAQITGEKEKGDALLQSMDEKIHQVQQRLPQGQTKRIAILHSTAQGLSVQLDGSIAGSTAKMLGFENVAASMKPLENNQDAAPYSIETLVEQNPDILFITSMGRLEDIKASMQKTIDENPAWQSIPAIQTKQYYYLPQEEFLLSPGIHYPEAVETMAKLVYPEAF